MRPDSPFCEFEHPIFLVLYIGVLIFLLADFSHLWFWNSKSESPSRIEIYHAVQEFQNDPAAY